MPLKGIILAGGSGSRLWPLTKVTNKHLLPVGNKPMIYHPIEKLTEAGIVHILIITGKEHLGDVVRLLGSGHDFNCSFTYKVQDQAAGIAHALALGENFCHGDPCVVILGDNIFESSIKEHVSFFKKQDKGARLLLSEVEDPQRFGVATLANERIVAITEKPINPPSNLAVTGIYMYDSTVFDYIKRCHPSARGELEISHVNQFYVDDGLCHYDVLSGWWTDAGTFSSLQRANRYFN